MTGTLKARIEPLERPAEKTTGGLVWLVPIPEGEPLPKSYSVGDFHVIYGRAADLDAIAAL
jgi:hypothetical protein